MFTQQVLIVVTVPPDNVNALLDAISAAGGGIIGNYTHCAYVSMGTGRFKPSKIAQPHLGAKSVINQVDEHRIETFCDRNQARTVVAAIRAAHPYEEPVIYIIPLLAEADL
jgi:hypothetical protein